MSKFLSFLGLLFIFCIISQKGKAQIKFDFKKSFPKLQVSPKSYYSLDKTNNYILNNNPNATLIDSGTVFKIFQLPLDKMPCVTLTPYFTNNIRVYNPLDNLQTLPSAIPNALPINPVINN